MSARRRPAIIESESGGAKEGWKARRGKDGVKPFMRSSKDDCPLVACRGVTEIPREVNMELVQAQFLKAYDNSAGLAQQMRKSGDVFLLCSSTRVRDLSSRYPWVRVYSRKEDSGSVSER